MAARHHRPDAKDPMGRPARIRAPSSASPSGALSFSTTRARSHGLIRGASPPLSTQRLVPLAHIVPMTGQADSLVGEESVSTWRSGRAPSNKIKDTYTPPHIPPETTKLK